MAKLIQIEIKFVMEIMNNFNLLAFVIGFIHRYSHLILLQFCLALRCLVIAYHHQLLVMLVGKSSEVKPHSMRQMKLMLVGCG